MHIGWLLEWLQLINNSNAALWNAFIDQEFPNDTNGGSSFKKTFLDIGQCTHLDDAEQQAVAFVL